MPTSLHVIRLAGIWEIARRHADPPRPADRSGERSGASLDWTRVRLDRLEEAGLPFAPCVCRRFFNRPTNLAAGQPVYLEWTGLAGATQIRLNDVLAVQIAGGAETVRLRVDDRLNERNELQLVLLDRTSDGASDADETGAIPAWPFRDCRLLIAEG